MANHIYKTNHVVKLDADNWNTWNFQITVILKHAALWDVVSGATIRPEDAAPAASWDKKNLQAMALIVPTLNEVNTTCLGVNGLLQLTRPQI